MNIKYPSEDHILIVGLVICLILYFTALVIVALK